MSVINTRGVWYKSKINLLLETVKCTGDILSYHLEQQSTLHLWHQFLNSKVIYFGFCECHFGNFPENVCKTSSYEAVTPYGRQKFSYFLE